ncbi:MAG: monofunctional biosynthetic peptidoglycan transglycosylase [Methylococcales bacterium]|nr:monofunctional biosynthetic peptidoglycan transglycosylase [Methylococcales bacterium]
MMKRLKRAALILMTLFLTLSAGPVALLRVFDPPTSAFMLTRQWQLFWQRGVPWGIDYRWRPYSRISVNLKRAVIASEDQKFATHHGFDFAQIEQALTDYRHGKPLRGASTLSQQTAKNLFLAASRSWLRKLLETWFTVLLELILSKQRILEIYLNIAEFGDGIYGAEAASQQFFNRSASDLNEAQAALLASVLPNPKQRQASHPSPVMRQKQQWILQQMRLVTLP